MATTSNSVRTPLHLWIVGGIGLLWNAFGAYDYLASKLQGEPYYRAMGMTDAQIAYMNAFPAWMTVVWATGVWGALLGTVLLLLRKRAAAPVFLLSLAAFLASLAYAYLLSDGAAVMGDMAYMQIVVLAGCLFFAGYARALARKGVLT
jgi:FtsH-binding integral membrane protein